MEPMRGVMSAPGIMAAADTDTATAQRQLYFNTPVSDVRRARRVYACFSARSPITGNFTFLLVYAVNII